jgi:catechol 2,3-dioxygenase-like lactoylglutathione lyase family enzyme
MTAAATRAGVVAVRSVEFSVRDIERSAQFYEDVFALEIVGREGGIRYLRASGPEHHVLVLRSGDVSGIASVELAVDNRAGVDELYEHLASVAHSITVPAERDLPGGGYGFSFVDASGRHWQLSSGVTQHAQSEHTLDRPFKVSHVVLNAPEITDDMRFATEYLGFRVRDESKSMFFLGCNFDHHSLAFARARNTTVNHVAFEVRDMDALMRGAGRMKRNGFPMQWGVGRHGPGANVYSYFLDPDSIPVEYTTEIMQVDDTTYRPGTPANWMRPPYFDAWGLADPPTPEFVAASGGAQTESEWRSSWRTMLK